MLNLQITGIKCAPNTPFFLFPESYIEPSLDTFPLCNVFNPDGCQSFTNISENSLKLEKLNVFPNPVSSELTISFFLNTSSLLKIKLYNIKGQLMDFVHNTNYPIGYNTISCPVDKIINGVYYLKIEIDGVSEIKKIIKI
jgi:hypothetical protein